MSKSGTCVKCGVYRESLHRDHIIPKWRGGNDDASNIQYLCANCHEDKTRAESQSEEFRIRASNVDHSNSGRYKKLSDDKILIIQALHSEGYEVGMIAKALGVTNMTVHRYLGTVAYYNKADK